MKKFKYLFKLLVFIGAISFVSCEDEMNLDLIENPNSLTEITNPDFTLNAVQINFANAVELFGHSSSSVVRMDYMNGRQYVNAYSPASFDYEWRLSYAVIMHDIKSMNAIAEEKGMKHHIGMGQVMQAYMMMTLVDFFGDVPYSETLLGSENLNPIADPGASVYAEAIALLDKAIINFSETASAEPETDLYYDKDWAKWTKAANTLKMKAYMTTKLVDTDAVSKFNVIVASGDYISATADDFQFRWGTNETGPESRHRRYRASYTSTGGGRYMSNSLMDYMNGEGDAAYSTPVKFDPRTLFYFYRQSSATPGIAGEPANEEKLECGLIPAPSHYAGYTYCGVAKGWWGRDHGNDRGIPPDGFDRTLAGVYPAGGVLDDLTYAPRKNGAGDKGAGITPIMLASWTKFMIAENKMDAGLDGEAKTLMFEGIDISIDKVLNFSTTTDRFNNIFDGDPLLSMADYTTKFKNDLGAVWDTGNTDDKWNILAMQYFVASFGNGNDPYNFYRRTGYPTTLQPNLEPNPGGFIRSFFYPANHANTNASITQKDGVGIQVFWDTNESSPTFPVAN